MAVLVPGGTPVFVLGGEQSGVGGRELHVEAQVLCRAGRGVDGLLGDLDTEHLWEASLMGFAQCSAKPPTLAEGGSHTTKGSRARWRPAPRRRLSQQARSASTQEATCSQRRLCGRRRACWSAGRTAGAPAKGM